MMRTEKKVVSILMIGMLLCLATSLYSADVNAKEFTVDNLSITVTSNPSPIEAGQQFSIQVKVKNTGNERENNILIALPLVGPGENRKTIEDLNPGENKSLEFTGEAEIAGEEIYIYIDNTPKKFVTVAPSEKPDLTVTKVTLKPEEPEEGESATVRFVVKNQGESSTPEGTSFDVRLSITGALFENQKKNYKKTISKTLAPGDNWADNFPNVVLSPKSGYVTATVTVDSNHNIAETDEKNNHHSEPVHVVSGEGGGYSLILLLLIFLLVLGGGITVVYILTIGKGAEGPTVMAPSKRSSKEVGDTMEKVKDDLELADELVSESKEIGADVSVEDELMESAKDFHKRAEEERSNEKYDSAYAYARGAFILSQWISRKIEDKRRAAVEAEDRIEEVGGLLETVKEDMQEARNRGIDVSASASLSDLATKLVESTSEVDNPEFYQFQADTIRKIAERADDLLEESASEQEEQINRTEKRIKAADNSLEKVEELIEKRRDEFDTLLPEYWLNVAEEVREIADNKELDAEVRESMADTTVRICEWIEGMFERRDVRSRMKKGDSGGIIRR